MGWGDEIMVTGEVKRQAAGSARRFAIFDARKTGMHRWNELWWGNPRIAFPGEPYDGRIYNHGGARPYIAIKTARCWQWRAYRPEPGEIFLKPDELALADQGAGCVILHCEIKPGASPNKQWPHKSWQALVDARPDIPWLQIGQFAPGEQRLLGVRFLETASFRHACAVLSRAKAAVLHEGGLHHAAAAFGIPAVVLYGGFISPECTGYDLHRNLFAPSREYPLGCGMRVGCFHCEQAMASFTPRFVAHKLEEVL